MQASNLIRFGQVGIAISLAGMMLVLIGLFPGLTGVAPIAGIGIAQVLLWWSGYALLLLGGALYVKVSFYPFVPSNLAQQVGLRLALTGLLFAALAGLADMLGFGSHIRTETTDIFLGELQAAGILASLAMASLGILLYAVAGPAAAPSAQEG
jgi:hypothetical protein